MTARRRAEELERRRQRRLAELDCEEALAAAPPRLAGAALVVPQGLLDRLAGATDFFVTRTEVLHAKNVDEAYRLALVAVDLSHDPEHDQVRYLANPFVRTEFGDFEATGITGRWAEMWDRGQPPW